MEFLYSLLTSDFLAVVVISLFALNYIVYIKPALSERDALRGRENELLNKLAKIEDVERLFKQFQSDPTAVAMMTGFKSDLIGMITALNANMEIMLASLSTQGEGMSGVTKDMEDMKQQVVNILENGKRIIRYATNHSTNLEILNTNIATTLGTLEQLHRLATAITKELEAKELISAIDPAIYSQFNHTLDSSKKDVNLMLKFFQEFMNIESSKNSSRFNKLVNVPDTNEGDQNV